MKNILVTGAAGFIGSNFLKKICISEDIRKNYSFHIVDALTYAGHYPNIESEIKQNSNLTFTRMNIQDLLETQKMFTRHDFDGVINFAAESHVDRSIKNPNIFVETNVLGTLNLLNQSLERCKDRPGFRFLQVSTDEVYGDLHEGEPAFTEEHPLRPNSPYSASKASADMLVRSFINTYALPAIITRCSNNYGPYQFPEKLIPLMIHCAKNNLKLPVYGKGQNIRDWIHVDDHNVGVWKAFTVGRLGQVYNFGGNSEKRNIEVVKMILKLMGKPEDLISYVPDRLGHDKRYAINFEKAGAELDFRPSVSFEAGLKNTIEWYESNQDWLNCVFKKAK